MTERFPPIPCTETPALSPYEGDTSQGMEGDGANTIPSADGKITRKDIQRADAMLVEGYEGDYLDEITYEMVRDKIGEEGQACDDDPTWWSDTVHTYCWYSTSDDTTLTVSFRRCKRQGDDLLRVGDERRRLREGVGDAGRLTTDPCAVFLQYRRQPLSSGKEREPREREYKWDKDQMNGTVR